MNCTHVEMHAIQRTYLKERTCKKGTSAEDYTGVSVQLSEQVLIVCVFRHYDIIVWFGFVLLRESRREAVRVTGWLTVLHEGLSGGNNRAASQIAGFCPIKRLNKTWPTVCK
jgi:hypothetical protein